jgi:hypothetical protein
MRDHTPTPEWDDEPALLDELGRALGHDPDAAPPPDRVAAIRSAAERMHPRRRSPRRSFLAGGVAAGVGGVAGYLGRRAREDQPAPPTAGPPTEAIAFTGDAEVTTSSLINHTWGTELLIDLTGLAAGTTYQVVYETAEGDVTAGSLLAVAGVVMRCRFNAATLRTEVAAIELRPPDGATVLRAQLPRAEA